MVDMPDIPLPSLDFLGGAGELTQAVVSIIPILFLMFAALLLGHLHKQGRLRKLPLFRQLYARQFNINVMIWEVSGNQIYADRTDRARHVKVKGKDVYELMNENTTIPAPSYEFLSPKNWLNVWSPIRGEYHPLTFDVRTERVMVVDKDGNPVPLTDEHGKPVLLKGKDGKPIPLTDEHGKPVKGKDDKALYQFVPRVELRRILELTPRVDPALLHAYADSIEQDTKFWEEPTPWWKEYAPYLMIGFIIIGMILNNLLTADAQYKIAAANEATMKHVDEVMARSERVLNRLDEYAAKDSSVKQSQPPPG
jgi:hypothetical protein